MSTDIQIIACLRTININTLKSFNVEKGTEKITMGRAPVCDIKIGDNRVSNIHC